MKRIIHQYGARKDQVWNMIEISRCHLLPKLSFRAILTESDSGDKETKRIPQQEQESWPTFQGFSVANYHKMQRERKYKSSLMEHLEMTSQKTRSYFDRGFEMLTGHRIDGAGNWLLTFSLCVASCVSLILYRRYNDQLRLQMDDILTYRDQLQNEIANLKQQMDDINNNIE